MNSIVGIHHITAIAGDPQQNIEFYTAVLGLRLVKVTVNFDDPEAYHLCYGDGQGRPGTILTFFAWPGARRGRQGNSQVTAAAFAVPQGSLPFLTERMAAHGIASVRYDKRGIGETGKSMQLAAEKAKTVLREEDLSFETYIDDAVSWSKKLV